MTTQEQLTPQGFRTAAYLETRARMDVRRKKTRGNIQCNPPNKQCGGRCIPPEWDCRLKNEGSDAHLRAVKSDPLGGLASIERGSKRLIKGVAKGSFSDVEGGRNALIRGAVKIAPGDLQQKKELTSQLKNRTAAIGVGLAVLTGGIGAHAILMNSTWYRQGVGRRINEAVPRGINAVLDALPVIGAERARVRSAAAVATQGAAERATTNLSSSPEILTSRIGQGSELVLGSTRASQASTALSTAVKAVDDQGSNNNLFNWNAKHRNAFWNATIQASDITEKQQNGEKALVRINVFARPAAEAYLASQYNLSSTDTSDTQTLKNAIESRIISEKDNYVRLAKQQGYRIQKTGGTETVHPEDLGRFITRNRPLSTQGERHSRPMRDAMDSYVRSVLTTPASAIQREVYRDTILGFDTFYKSFGQSTQEVAGASAAGPNKRSFVGAGAFQDRVGSAARTTGGYEDLRITADIARARYLKRELKITQEVAGPNHAELINATYYHHRVVSGATRRSTYQITDRLAVAAASELTGRTVGPREAFSLLNTQYGFSKARRITQVPPLQRGERKREMTEAEAIYQLMRQEGLSRTAAQAEVRRRRGDSPEDDVPVRARVYLQLRRDLKERPRLGKPCGKSYIPKDRNCKQGQNVVQTVEQPKAEANKSSLGTKTLLTATGIAVTGTLLGVLAKDTFTSGIPKDKVPPKEAPEGLYDTFKPGDLIYQSIDFLGANRAHYAVYLGKKDGVHQVFDVSPGKGTRAAVPIMSTKTIEEAKNNGSSFAKAERVAKDNKQPTTEQLHSLISKLNNKSFDWVGFERNCETFARSIVNDLPVSTQTKDVTKPTQKIVTALVSSLSPNKYRRRAFKQKHVENLVRRAIGDAAPSAKGQPCGESYIPKAHKCRKGAGAPSEPVKPSSGLNGATKIAIAAGVGAVGSVALLTALGVQKSKITQYKNNVSQSAVEAEKLALEYERTFKTQAASRLKKPIEDVTGFEASVFNFKDKGQDRGFGGMDNDPAWFGQTPNSRGAVVMLSYADDNKFTTRGQGSYQMVKGGAFQQIWGDRDILPYANNISQPTGSPLDDIQVKQRGEFLDKVGNVAGSKVQNAVKGGLGMADSLKRFEFLRKNIDERGFNPDAVRAAAFVVAQRRLTGKSVDIMSYSNGGNVATETLAILNEMGYRDVKVVNVAGPTFGIFNHSRDNMRTWVSEGDSFYTSSKGLAYKGGNTKLLNNPNIPHGLMEKIDPNNQEFGSQAKANLKAKNSYLLDEQLRKEAYTFLTVDKKRSRELVDEIVWRSSENKPFEGDLATLFGDTATQKLADYKKQLTSSGSSQAVKDKIRDEVEGQMLNSWYGGYDSKKVKKAQDSIRAELATQVSPKQRTVKPRRPLSLSDRINRLMEQNPGMTREAARNQAQRDTRGLKTDAYDSVFKLTLTSLRQRVA